MVTIQIKNIEGKTVLPIAGSKRAAGYDIVAIDDPIIVGESTMVEGDFFPSYHRIDYIEYHTALYISPQDSTQFAHHNREYHHTLIHPRSSIRKYNLVLANSIGLIDNDFRGEILLCFKYIWQPEDCSLVKEKVGLVQETSDTTWTQEYDYKMKWKPNMNKIYKKGDRIGQLVADKTNPAEFVLVSELDLTERGEGGFGSTDNTTSPKFTEQIIPIRKQNIKKEGEVVTDSSANAPTELKTVFGDIVERYQKAGGVPIKKKYIDEVKERNETI